MQKLADYLQRNPMVVLAMFVISVLGGVMTIVLGWQTFYADYLSRSVDVPVWLILLAMLFGGALFLFRRQDYSKLKELTRISGNQFGVQQIELDGKSFEHCTFHGTELIFRGINGFSITHSRFVTPPQFTLAGPASNTVVMLQRMLRDGAFAHIVNDYLAQIRAGTFRERIGS